MFDVKGAFSNFAIKLSGSQTFWRAQKAIWCLTQFWHKIRKLKCLFWLLFASIAFHFISPSDNFVYTKFIVHWPTFNVACAHPRYPEGRYKCTFLQLGCCKKFSPSKLILSPSREKSKETVRDISHNLRLARIDFATDGWLKVSQFWFSAIDDKKFNINANKIKSWRTKN